MMIYANGRGVHKNIPYAMHLACLSSWAPAEETERLEDLRARQYKPSTRPFDFCDGATSGYVGGICSSHHARLQDVELDRSIIDFQKKLSPNAQKSFQNVLEKQKKWTKKTSENEVDLTGTDRASETIEAEENQKKNFVALLIRLQRSDFPKYTQKDIIKSNAIMKISLAKLKKEGVIPNSTIEWNGISETQKTWERYRDAWGDFAEKVYPAWGKQGAEAWISMERAKMLESMAH
ncbi:hypothetical protein [Saccharibacter sp. 17.LH.SD]|uniref:hypothetical protein n=1 Tax=Saccharibacter sp. 17.LH.SD TaxID=2689393 RepID=UPI001F2D53F8|nr:hypothetical protein [Saccharibacter sp. 17.LH.SD]